MSSRISLRSGKTLTPIEPNRTRKRLSKKIDVKSNDDLIIQGEENISQAESPVKRLEVFSPVKKKKSFLAETPIQSSRPSMSRTIHVEEKLIGNTEENTSQPLSTKESKNATPIADNERNVSPMNKAELENIPVTPKEPRKRLSKEIHVETLTGSTTENKTEPGSAEKQVKISIDSTKSPLGENNSELTGKLTYTPVEPKSRKRLSKKVEDKSDDPRTVEENIIQSKKLKSPQEPSPVDGEKGQQKALTIAKPENKNIERKLTGRKERIRQKLANMPRKNKLWRIQAKKMIEMKPNVVSRMVVKRGHLVLGGNEYPVKKACFSRLVKYNLKSKVKFDWNYEFLFWKKQREEAADEKMSARKEAEMFAREMIKNLKNLRYFWPMSPTKVLKKLFPDIRIKRMNKKGAHIKTFEIWKPDGSVQATATGVQKFRTMHDASAKALFKMLEDVTEEQLKEMDLEKLVNFAVHEMLSRWGLMQKFRDWDNLKAGYLPQFVHITKKGRMCRPQIKKRKKKPSTEGVVKEPKVNGEREIPEKTGPKKRRIRNTKMNKKIKMPALPALGLGDRDFVYPKKKRKITEESYPGAKNGKRFHSSDDSEKTKNKRKAEEKNGDIEIRV